MFSKTETDLPVTVMENLKKNLFEKDRFKIRSEFCSIARVNHETKTSFSITVRLLKNAIGLKR